MIFRANNLVTLTTDFGTSDSYVGAMTGVLYSRVPEIRIAEISHAVSPGDVRLGSYIFADAAKNFPRGTIHLVIVDPGVGTNRRGIAVLCNEQIFIGPDNGLVTQWLENQTYQAWELASPDFWAANVSPTFHGRDIFAPVAASILAGCSLNELGPEIHDVITLDSTNFFSSHEAWGIVLGADRFGNLQTSLDLASLKQWSPDLDFTVFAGDQEMTGIYRTFADIPDHQAGLLMNSFGRLEIACNQKRASDTLSLFAGQRLRILKRGSRETSGHME